MPTDFTDFHGLAPALPGFCRSIQARFFDGRGGTRFPLIENGLGGMEEEEVAHGLARIFTDGRLWDVCSGLLAG